MTNFIVAPPNKLISMTLPVCGPLGKHAYKFSVTHEAVPEQLVREFYGDQGGTAILQGPTMGVYDVNLMIHAPPNSLPPPPPDGWVPGFNKHVVEPMPGIEWHFIWGVENPQNQYVRLVATVGDP